MNSQTVWTALSCAVLGLGANAELITVEAEADHYGLGSSGDTLQTSPGPNDATFLTKNSGSSPGSSRKAWVRFNLSSFEVDGELPAEIVWRIGTVQTALTGSWQVWALKSGYTPGEGVQGIDWTEATLTWNNGPANSVTSRNSFSTAAATKLGTVAFSESLHPLGTEFQRAIPQLGDYLQSDGTVTVMFSVDTQSSSGPMIAICSSEHPDYDGPQLVFTGSRGGTVISVR